MLQFTVDPDISLARTPDARLYTDPSVFRQTKEKWFAPSWQFIGDTGFVKEAGDVWPFVLLDEYLDEPLILVRDKDKEGTIHLLSNVCTHRGNLLAAEPCRVSNLRCRYHGRLFHLDGKFLSMPEFREVKDFPAATDNLARLPLFRWGPWLFTSLGNQIPASAFLADMINRLQWLPVDDFVFHPEKSRDFTVRANWALYCENYLEGFHIPFVHAGLNTVIDFGNYTTEVFRYSNLQLGIAKEDEDCFDLPSSSPDYGKKVAAYYFFIFPNMMFNFYPWGLSINIVKPIGIDETKISFLTYIYDESKYNSGAGSGLDQVEIEDEEVVEAVQKGVRSRFYSHGRYSVTREQGTHHFHRILSELWA
jgi:choline monooxygenase